MFEKDTWGLFSESVTVTNFAELSDKVLYDYIFIQLIDDSKPISLPSTLNFSSNSNLILDAFRGETVKFDFGSLIIIVDKEHGKSLLEYLKPNESSYNSQKKEFIQNIISLYEKKEYTREKVLSLLKNSSQCLFEYLTQEQRISLLTLINDGSNISEVTERVVIDIVRTTPISQIEYLFSHLSSDGLMKYYDGSINDINGKDYYTKFIAELFKLYKLKYSKVLSDCFKAPEWGAIAVQVRTQIVDLGSYSFISQNPIPYFEWSENCDIPLWRYNGNKIEVINSTCGRYISNRPFLDPFEPIVLNIRNELPFFKLSSNETVIAVPAFVMIWLRQQAVNKKGAELVDDAVTIIDGCLTLGEGTLIAKGVSKAVLITFKYYKKINSVISIILTNESIKNGIMKIGSNGEGTNFVNKFEKEFSWKNDYIYEPGLELLITRDFKTVLVEYIDLQKSWDAVKVSTDIRKHLNDEQINELSDVLNQTIKDLKSQQNVVE